jgi:hypothetical protein
MRSVEVLAVVLLGAALIWIVVEPLVSVDWRPPLPGLDPPDLEATPQGTALVALKDLELDYATGKLSVADYQELKTRYTAAAVALLRESSTEVAAAAFCPACGLSIAGDARFCSGCGRPTREENPPPAVAGDG